MSIDDPKVAQELIELLKRLNGEKERNVKLSDDAANHLEREIAAYKEAIKDEDNLYKIKSATNSLREAENELNRRSLETIRQKIVQNTELNAKEQQLLETLKIQGETLDESLKNTEKKLDILDLQNQAQKDLNTKLSEQGPLSVKVQRSAALMAEAFAQGKTSILLMNRASIALDVGLSKYINSIKGIVFGINEAQKGFERATAGIFGPSVSKQVTATYKELNLYNVSAKQAFNSQLGLSRVVTDFTTYNATLQSELRTSALMFEQLGVSQENYNKGIQGAIKFFSATPMQAEKMSRELLATAEALGVVPADMMEQYGRMGPQLAKFGNQGQKVFKDLARIQKQTGFEMEKILQITNRFDTFEGAAQQAGQLNAALGGNFVNAMDLMMATDPAERFDMIRDALEQTGLSFDEMSYYQKEFYKNTLGLSDVGELAMIMSGDMDSFGDATNKSAKDLIDMKQTAKDVQSVMEAFQSVIANNADVFIAIAGALEKFSAILLDNAGVVKAVVYGLMGLKVAQIGINAAMVAYKVYQGGAIAAQKIATVTTNLFAKAKEREAAAKGKVNLADKSTIPPKPVPPAAGASMLKFAFAVGAVAAGLGLAAIGMAQLIGAVKDATAGDIALAAGLFLGLSVAIGGLTFALIKFAPVGSMAAPALLALGGAAALVGAGVGLAAFGVSKLVESFQGFSADEITGIGVAMIGFGVAVAGLAYALSLLGNPLSMAGAATLAVIGAGIGGLAFGLSKLKGEKDGAKELIPVMNSVGGITSTQFELADKTFKSIKDSINATETSKMKGLGNLFGDIHIHYVETATRVNTGAPAAQDGGTGNNQSGQMGALKVDVPIQLEIGGRPLDKYILKLVKDNSTNEMRAAVQKKGSVVP